MLLVMTCVSANLGSNIFFFCQLPYCVDAIMAAQVTQELMCVLSVRELVFIVHVCMYGCFLHSCRLSSILFFGGLALTVTSPRQGEKITILVSGF